MKTAKAELLTAEPRKLFLRYLGPGIAGTMMVAANYFIDTLCVGQNLGETGLAALNICQPIPAVFYGLGYLLGVGGGTLYSAYLGKGDTKAARRVYTTCITTLVAVSVLLCVLGLIFLPQITAFMGGTGSLERGVREYLLFFLIFSPCFAIETGMVTMVRNDNTPRLSMMATLIGCSLNIVLDVLFLYGFGWGIWSASLATSVAVLLSSTILLTSTLRKKSGLKLMRGGYDKKELLNAGKVGLPSFLNEMTGAVVTLTFNSVLLRISGETAVAVYGVIASMSLVISSGLMGVTNAMQPLVSVNSGAGKQARVDKFLKMALVASLGLSGFFMLLGEVWPEALVRIFIEPDAGFLALAIPAVRIYFISFVIMAANILIGVYCQSVQAASEAFMLTLLRSIVLPVASVTTCAIFFGLDGVWASTIVAESIALLAGFWLFGKVRAGQREKNYAALRYFSTVRRKDQETLEGILDDLGAEDLTAFTELVAQCNARDEKNQGIPAFIGLDDLTSDEEGAYTPAYDDEDMGLLLAVGALLFTDLCEQNEEYQKEKKLGEAFPAVAPAMAALARKAFRFEYNEDTDESTIVPYLCETKDGTITPIEKDGYKHD